MLVSFHNRHTLNQRYTQMKALSPKLKIKFKSLVAFGNQECFIMHNSFFCVEAVSWDKLLKQTRSKRKTNAEIKGYQLFTYIVISGGPLSALTCCVNVRLLSAIKKISPLIYSQSWVGSWVYTTQAMMTFTLIF